jgi:drug/metabolite transporter (DMT)-like permease
MNAGSIGFASAAAIFLALGAALQHQVAARQQGFRNGIHLLWRLLRNRRWLVGLAAGLAGAALHAAALRAGALAVVQSVLVMSLALALPARALLDRMRPSAVQVVAATILAVGVAIFVASVHPQAGQPAPDSRGTALVIGSGVLLAALCSVTAARTRSGRVAGFALGLAAGTLYGLTGGVLKALVHAALGDPVAVVTGWPLWVLAVLGGWAMVVHQRAYAHAPLRVSLPPLSVANPLAGMAFGILAFRETPATGLLALVGAIVGLAVIVASVTMLAQVPARPERPAQPHARV